MKNTVFWDVTPCGTCYVPTFCTNWVFYISEEGFLHGRRRENVKPIFTAQ
jgi:hypothetical protein